MTKGRKILEKIMKYIENARRYYPEITNDLLCDAGKVYYMNGNDGTVFDWKCNGRCCEFYLFYKETEYGFIKVFVNADDTINGYVYLDKGHAKAIHLEKTGLNKGEALYLASLLKLEADGKNFWDTTIDKIDFDRKLKSNELLS